jgi:hypothetical protein
MGIEPLGVLERTPAVVEARLWPGPQVAQVAEEVVRDGA